MSKGNCRQSMLEKLRGIGLYACDGQSLVEAELAAYAQGLELVSEALWELEQESFVATASGYGLELRERLCGGLRDFLPLSSRREMLQYRMAVTVNDYHARSLEKALLAAGVRASISDMSDRSVYVNVLGLVGDRQKTQAEVQAAAAEFLPAHAVWQFDFGVLSWDYIDGQGNTFAQMDASDRTWDSIDAYTEAA